MSWKKTIQPEAKSWRSTVQPEPQGDALMAGIEGFGQGASMGYLAQLQALAGQLVPDPNADLDAKLKAEGFNIEQGNDSYLQMRDENIARQGRLEESNPYIYGGAQVAGAIATAPAMEARIAKMLPAAAKGSLILRGGATGAAIGAAQNPGDVEGKINPVQGLERLGNAAIGGGLGLGLGALGSLGSRAAKPPVKSTEVPVDDDSIFKFLSGQKGNAAEIKAAAEELGAPVLTGQTSSNRFVRGVEDMLQNSGSLIGQRRRKIAEEGLDAVRGTMTQNLDGAAGETLASTGSKLKESIAGKIREESAPISQIYNTVKESTKNIPVAEKSVKAIARNIGKLDDVRAGEGFESGSFAKTIMNRVEGIKTVDDIKRLRTIIRTNATTPERKAVLRAIDPKLRALEENTIVRAAKSLAKDTGDSRLGKNLMGLVDERKSADAAYSGLMNNIRELAGIVKKGRVQGPESFAQVIESIGDEEFAKKLLAKGNHKQLKFMQETFPDEAASIFNLEKKRILESATKDGVVNPRQVLREVGKLSPEVQEIIFGKGAVKKLKSARTYIESIPESKNPSGTEYTKQAYEFFTDPIKWVGSNTRDAAMLGFLKAAEAGDGAAMSGVYKKGADAGRKALSALDPAQKRLRIAAIQGGVENRKPYAGNDRRKALRLRAMGE